MKCIFCLNEKPESSEHIFPQAIGGPLVTSRVCHTCNSELGKGADASLINHLYVVLRRSQLRLAGNSGTVPDAMRALMTHATLASDPSQKFRVSTTADGNIDIFLVYHDTTRDLGDGRQQREVRLDPRETHKIPEIVQSARKRAGMPPLDKADLDKYVDEAVLRVTSLQDGMLHGRPTVDLVDYKMGVLKIVYELTHLWLGDSWLDDHTASEMRDAILGRKELGNTTLRGGLQLGTPSIFVPWASEPDIHLAFISRSGNQIAVSIRIFDVLGGVVTASQKAAQYGLVDGLEHGQVVRIDALQRVAVQRSMLEEIASLQA